MSTSLKSALKSSAMIVALWAPVYFVLIESFGLESMPRSDLFQWGLVAVGALGLGSILFTAWRDTRNPAWRAAHGLPPLRPARIAGASPALAKAELQAGA
jgi:hypothetical protein